MDLCTELDKLLVVDESVEPLGIFVAYTISWCEHEAQPDISVIDEETSKLIGYLKSRYTLDTLKNDRIVRAYRDFYWRIGIDPTKTRPASEALVRRALRNSFPRINPVVDAGNIASAYTMVPIGMYDLRFARPPLRITLSQGGEVFKPIGGKEEVLPAGIPILIDSQGLVMHIYPHRDSVETMIRSDTKLVLTIGAGVPNVPKDLVVEAVKKVTELLSRLGWKSCNDIIVKGFYKE